MFFYFAKERKEKIDEKQKKLKIPLAIVAVVWYIIYNYFYKWAYSVLRARAHV